MNSNPYLSALSQWHGTPTSEPYVFQVPGLPSLHFVLFGSVAGTVALQGYEVNPPKSGSSAGNPAPLPNSPTMPTTLSNPAGPATLPPLTVSTSGRIRGPGTGNGTSTPSQLTAQLVMTLKTSKGGKVDEPVSHVSWGGGARHLVAAAVGYNACLLSLETFFEAMFMGEQEGTLRQGPAANAGYQQLQVWALRAPLVALAWTQTVDGLAVSDTRGNIHVARITEVPMSGASMHQSGAENGERNVMAECRLEEVWTASIPSQQQTVLAAGFEVGAPVASCRGGVARTLSVWWPPVPPVTEIKTRQLPQARQEVLRHPCAVLACEWSPGLLQQMCFEVEERGHTRLRSASSSDLEDGYGAPALLTTGIDGAIRIWVEVTLVPMGPHGRVPFGSNGKGVPPEGVPRPGTPLRHFCVTLVIELPTMLRKALGPPGRPQGTLHACWATPLGCVLPTASQYYSMVAKVLWLVASVTHTDGSQSAAVWAVESLAALRGVPGNMQQQQRLPRGVLWGVANLPGRQLGGALSRGAAGARHPYEGKASNSVLRRSSTDGASGMASKLFCFASFNAEIPLLLLYHSRPQPPPCSPTLPLTTPAASSESAQQTPMLEVPFVSFTRLSTLEDDACSPLACNVTANHISILEDSVLSSVAHSDSISCTALHPTHDLAATVDRSGSALLWRTSPVMPVHVLRQGAQASEPLETLPYGNSVAIFTEGSGLHVAANAGVPGGPVEGDVEGDVEKGHHRSSGQRPVTVACWLAVHPSSCSITGTGAPHHMLALLGLDGLEVMDVDRDSQGVWCAYGSTLHCALPPYTTAIVAAAQIPQHCHRSSEAGQDVNSRAVLMASWIKRATPTGYTSTPTLVHGFDSLCVWSLTLERASKPQATPTAGLDAGPPGGPSAVAVDVISVLPSGSGGMTCWRMLQDSEGMLVGCHNGVVAVLSTRQLHMGVTTLMAVLYADAARTPPPSPPSRLLQTSASLLGPAIAPVPQACMNATDGHQPVAAVAATCSGGLLAAAYAEDGGTDHFVIWNGAGSSGSVCTYKRETTTPLPDTPTDIAWLDPLGAAPCLAVSCAGIGVVVYTPGHPCVTAPLAPWTQVARFCASNATIMQIGVQSHAGIVATTGTTLTQVSLLLPSETGNAETTTTAATNASNSKSAATSLTVLHKALQSVVLPPYHPQCLSVLLAMGRTDIVCSVMESLVKYLQAERAARDKRSSGEDPERPGDQEPFSGDPASSATATGNTDGHGAGLPAAKCVTDPPQLPRLACGRNSMPHNLQVSMKALFDADAAESLKAVLATRSPPVHVHGAVAASCVHRDQSSLPYNSQHSSTGSRGGYAQPSNADTGMLDMSAFGMSHIAEPAQPAAPAAAVESGMLDMSAFGMSHIAETAPPAAPAAAVESGMLDMAAFGMSHIAETAPPAAPAAAVESGMLDMSAFGMSHIAEVAKPAAPVAALESGMLDMSAFGTSHAAQPAQPVTPAGAVQSDTLNMSTFGKSSVAAAGQRPASYGASRHKQPQHTLPVSRTPFTRTLLAQEILTQLTDLLTRSSCEPAEVEQPMFTYFTNQEAPSGSDINAKTFSALPGLSVEETEQLVQLVALACPPAANKVLLGAHNDVSKSDRQESLDEAGHRALHLMQLAALHQRQAPHMPASEASHTASNSGARSRRTLAASAAATGWVPPASPSLRQMGPSVMSFASLNPLPPRAINAAGVQVPVPTEQSSAAAAAAHDWGTHVGLMGGLRGGAVMWALLSATSKELLQRAVECVPDWMDPAPQSTAVSWSSSQQERSQGAVPSLRTNGLPSWPALRAVGAGFWLTDKALIRETAEQIARGAFAARKDASDCALLYLALGNKALLQNLFRTSHQTRLGDFLKRDFNEPKNKQAAKKNAFVLLGQHRHDLAAAFFVLGGALKDAAGVCLHNLGDPQLALFVCRLVEGGPGGPTERDIIEHELLPQAQTWRDPWGASLLHWLLGQHTTSIRTLLPSLEAHTNPESPNEVPLSMHSTAVPNASISPPSALTARLPAEGGTGPMSCSTDSADGGWATVQALHFVSFALLDAGLAALFRGVGPGGDQDPGYLGALDRLAAQSAVALSRAGLPLLALQTLQLAQSLMPAPPCRQVVDMRFESCRSLLLRAALSGMWDGLQVVGPHAAAQSRNDSSSNSLLLNQVTSYLQSLWPVCATTLGHTTDQSNALFEQWVQHAHHLLLHPSCRSGGAVLSLPSTSVSTPCRSSLRGSPVPSYVSLGQLFSRMFRQRQHMAAAASEAGRPAPPGVEGAFRPVLEEPLPLFTIHGDSIYGMCVSSMEAAVATTSLAAGARGGPVDPPGGPFVTVATSTHGLVEGEVLAPSNVEDLVSEVSSEGSSRSGVFSSLLYSMFEGMRWQTQGSDQPHQRSGTMGGDGGVGSANLPGLADLPDFMAPGSPRETGPLGVMAEDVVTSALEAHPTRPLYLTGHTTGQVLLWPFNSKHPLAVFSPSTRLDAGSDAERGVSSPIDSDQPSMAWFRSFSMSSAAAKPGMPVTWAYPMAIKFNGTGDRFAGIGDGGLLATWRLDAPRGPSANSWADWTVQGLARKGCDVCYIANSSSVIAVGGSGTSGAHVAVWDSLAPPRGMCVATMSYHSATVTRLAAVGHGGIYLASGDETGILAVQDLRMMGGQRARVLWKTEAVPKGAVTAVTGALHPAMSHAPMLAVGGKDGMVGLWDVQSGTQLQLLKMAHCISKKPGTGGKSSLSESIHATLRHSSTASGGSTVGMAVTGLRVVDRGLLSCGLDGAVKLHPWSL